MVLTVIAVGKTFDYVVNGQKMPGASDSCLVTQEHAEYLNLILSVFAIPGLYHALLPAGLRFSFSHLGLLPEGWKAPEENDVRDPLRHLFH